MAKQTNAVPKAECASMAECATANDQQDVSLTEVLHLAQSSVETLKEFLNRLDSAVGDDFHQIMEKISKTREDMQLLNVENSDICPLTDAENELKMVVQATEDATNRIMTAAETIMTADPKDEAHYHLTVESKIMEIFEACSFQDITGQRINRVVETLDFVDYRIHKIASFLGIETPSEKRNFDEQAFYKRMQRKDDLILHGPQEAGEGVNQDDIDNMF